ncbi:MAG TPA: hypothetical protein VMJ65_11585 [Solirubrobacteraceae bacterium]|nr:hypothetical protein [Solirubrobacteraceae bacterium]
MATVTGTSPVQRTETRRVPRTTGALSGLLVILLGIWGALIPFIGPYFHYAFGSFQTWHYTSERLWLCIVPGAVAVIGGLMLLRSSRRSSGLLGGWLAMAAGAWFAIGPSISLLWHHAGNPIGAPMGGATRQAIEWLGYFSGLGVLIAALAAFAMGRYFSRPRVIEEVPIAAEDAVGAHEARVDERRDAPMAESGAPVAATAAGEPVAAREDEPVATRADEPVAARDEEPVAEREPLAPREEPLAPREEPTAATTAEPAGTTAEPAATPEDTTGAPASITYRRRPGLSRLRRR